LILFFLFLSPLEKLLPLVVSFSLSCFFSSFCQGAPLRNQEEWDAQEYMGGTARGTGCYPMRATICGLVDDAVVNDISGVHLLFAFLLISSAEMLLLLLLLSLPRLPSFVIGFKSPSVIYSRSKRVGEKRKQKKKLG
jgi:hypothetical protein